MDSQDTSACTLPQQRRAAAGAAGANKEVAEAATAGAQASEEPGGGTVTTEEICDNGVDDNGDGLVDSQDTNACPAGGGGEQITEEICDNGVDDNGDGLVDSQDTNACPAGGGGEQITEEICDNGVDDNGDGLVDSQDTNACPAGGGGEQITEEICDNGVDDNGDGLVDSQDTNACPAGGGGESTGQEGVKGSDNASEKSAATVSNQTSISSEIVWINHLELMPGDSTVSTSFNAISSGIGEGLNGLIIESDTIGETTAGGGLKVVSTGLQVPPGYDISGIRICYELSNERSFISQIRLAQLQDPPSTSLVRLDDPTNQTNRGPICINSQQTSISPTNGEVLLSLRVNFGDTSDRIVIRALGMQIVQRT